MYIGIVTFLNVPPDATLDTVVPLSHQKILPPADVMSANDYFGAGTGSLGDLDGNTVVDLIVGADGYEPGTSVYTTGTVFILFLGLDFYPASYQQIGHDQGGFTWPLANYYQFGNSCDGMGDMDLDGVPDAVVAAQRDSTAGSYSGAVYLLYLTVTGTVKSSLKITDGVGGFTHQFDSYDIFGHSVARVNDINGDSFVDLLVGKIGDDDYVDAQGAVYVLFLNPTGFLSAQKISGLSGDFTALLDAKYFGSGCTGLPDVDGAHKVAASARYGDLAEVYVLFLTADATVASFQEINAESPGFTAVITADGFGYNLGGGDVNGDGISDLLVGQFDYYTSPSTSSYLIYLNREGTVRSHHRFAADSGLLTANIDYSDFGYQGRVVEDLNHDGVLDLVVSARKDDEVAYDAGAIFILFNSPYLGIDLKLTTV